jgi:hypothetical protein
MEITGKSTGVSIASSPFLEPLIDLLAGRLADVPDDPFATGIIVVPNVGVRDWLQRELCSRLETGIVANIQFMFVQQFLDTVFTASDSVSMQPWNIDHLTWTVHRAIDAVGRSTIPGALAKPLTVARVVADLFDRYRSELSTIGRSVRVELPSGEILRGRALGVGLDGRLEVLDSCAISHHIDVADIVHLRFEEGDQP